MKATFKKYTLQFKQASGTSRGVLLTKDTYFLTIEHHAKKGFGECALFRGLSCDDRPDYEEKLQWVCDHISLGKEKLWNALIEFPSIQFGVEQAFLSVESQDPFVLFPSQFTQGKAAIPINGLIWMGDKNFMQQQIKAKLAQGFSTLKMKIGAIDFETEIALLQSIRKEFSASDITLRVDANGAFTQQNALQKLARLSKLAIHSIEQPIKAGQWQEMAALCKATPLPIALDEELIGSTSSKEKQRMLSTINPQFIILKPSLIGGIQGSDEWIALAKKHQIDWWITSALESNIGLNAIAQYTFALQTKMPQGLGTGSLFSNNIEAPLHVISGALQYDNLKKWNYE